MSGNMYQNKPTNVKRTIYNTPVLVNENKTDEKQTEKKTPEQPQIKLLREAHITELTLGNQTLRVMDAGHIQGVINMIEKQDSSIKQLNKTANSQTRVITSLSQEITNLKRDVEELKRKLNGNYL